MQRPNVLVPQRVSEPCLMSALLYRGDVYVMRGIEILGLRSQFRFHVVKRKSLSAGQPGAVSEEGCGPVIHVEIDRPMGEDDIWFVLVQQDFGELLVALSCDFRPAPVDNGKRKLPAIGPAIVEAIQADLQNLRHSHRVEPVPDTALLGVCIPGWWWRPPG